MHLLNIISMTYTLAAVSSDNFLVEKSGLAKDTCRSENTTESAD